MVKKVKDKQLDKTVEVIEDYKPTVGSSIGINSMTDPKKIEDDDERDEIFDEDADNPPAGTPGHPGIDDDTG